MTSAAGSRGLLRLLALVGLLPCAAILTLALTSRSTGGTIVGRYSASFFAVIGMLAAGLVIAAVGLLKDDWTFSVAGIGILFTGTYLVFGNNGMAARPVLLPLAVAARVGLAGAMAFLAFRASSERGAGTRVAQKRLVIASLLLALAIFDSGLPALARATSPLPRPGFGFRDGVSLASIGPEGIAAVGDSFVWGAGVEADQAFPALLEARLAALGDRSAVYNLGQPGTGLDDYLGVIRRIQSARLIVVCWYANDMPERPTAARKARQVLAALGRSSLVLRLAGDLMGAGLYHDVGKYLDAVEADYERSDPGFAARWRWVESELDSLGREATLRSETQPVFVIFPIMRDFSGYRLRPAHAELSRKAASVGFRVLDLLPVFEREFPRPEIATVDGAHLGRAAHEVVARELLPLVGPGLER